jgi:transcriptional regulator with XRE-family HTH domain
VSKSPKRSIPHPAAELLRVRGIAHSAVASRLGCSTSHVNQCLNGRVKAPARVRSAVAEVLGLPEASCWRPDGASFRATLATPAKGYLAMRGFTQKDVAAATGYSQQWVHRVLAGHGEPPAALIAYLSKLLDLPAELLFPDDSFVEPGVMGGAE